MVAPRVVQGADRPGMDQAERLLGRPRRGY